MSCVDQFWLATFKSLIRDFDFDEVELNEDRVTEALKKIRTFISTNVTNKILINQKTDISEKLLNLTWKVCSNLPSHDAVHTDDASVSCVQADPEYQFTNELLHVLNNFVNGISQFRDDLIDHRLIRMLVLSIVNKDSKFRSGSIVLLRTLLNARNIHTCLKPDAKLTRILQEVITADLMRKLIIMPQSIGKFAILTEHNSNIHQDDNNNEIRHDKRTNHILFEILSVLATDSHLNALMFRNSSHSLLKSFNSILTDLTDLDKDISMFSHKPEVKYMLKCLVFYLYFDKQSYTNFQQYFRCDDDSSFCLQLYDNLQWIEDKYILPMLGLLHGLLFVRLCGVDANSKESQIHQTRNTFIDDSLNEKRKISSEDIVKNIIGPLTYNETYIEFNGLSSWLMHVLYLVLRQEIGLSDMVMQCNEFINVIDRNLTLKIQSFKATSFQSKKNYSKTGTVKLINLIHLLKLLAWMTAESESVKHKVGSCAFISKLLDCFYDDYASLLTLFNDNIRDPGVTDPEQIVQMKDRMKILLDNFSLQDLELHKTIWLLLQSLSRHFSLQRSLFGQLTKHAKFMKEIIELYLDSAGVIQYVYTPAMVEFLQQPESFVNEYKKLMIDTLKSALCAISNLILPTSPLNSDLLDWSVKLYIDITNGGKLTSALSSEYPELKLCGLRGLVNASYSIVVMDRFQSIVGKTSTHPHEMGRRRRRRTYMDTSGDAFPAADPRDRSNSPINLPMTFASSMEEDQSPQDYPDVSVMRNSTQQNQDSEPSTEPMVTTSTIATASVVTTAGVNHHVDLHQRLNKICTHLIETMPLSLSTSTQQTNANTTQTSFSASVELAGESRIPSLLSEPLSPDPSSIDDQSRGQVELSSEQMIIDHCPGSTQDLDSNNSQYYNEIHDRIGWMVWSLLRNTLHSAEAIEHIVPQHGVEIIKLIISTLESGHSYPVKEQALIALGHMSTNKDFRQNLLENEDLMEKIKLFSKSPYYPLKSASIFAAFYLNELYDKEVLEVNFAEDLRNDCSELWDYLENINKP